MITPLIGLVASSLCVLFLFVLFRYEARRGERIGEGPRHALDQLLAKTAHFLTALIRKMSRGAVRRMVHFLFHTVLVILLQCLRSLEERVHAALRQSRSRALRIREHRAEPNKLDAIAEHKAQVALSEEERRRRRVESLNS